MVGEEMSAARPPYSGGHGAQGVVAGGLWVRCGGTSGRNLLKGASAHVACAVAPTKFFSCQHF